jgi:hypothetical protein
MESAGRYDFSSHGGDPEYLAAARAGTKALEEFFSDKVRLAEESGDPAYLFEAVYYSLTVCFRADDRERFCAVARRLLTLPASNLQMPVYVASRLFEFYDEPGLALEMIEHGYKAITDAGSAFENLGYLVESKKLALSIQAALDPWSEETGQALYAVAMATAQPSEMNRFVLEAMKTITNRPTENWLDAWLQQSIVRSMWGRLAAEQCLSGHDRGSELAELEDMYKKVPLIQLPEMPGGARE